VAHGKLSFETQTVEGAESFGRAAIEAPWYQLDAEPEPVSSGAEIAQLLQDHAGVHDGVTELNGRFPRFGERGAGQSIVGLRYPGRETEPKWLILALVPNELLDKALADEQREGARREIMRDARVAVIKAHRVKRAELELRNQGTVPGALSSKSVLVLGCGALGADVAITLAKAGVGKLILVDPDFISAGNVIRHAAGLPATGLAKVDATRFASSCITTTHSSTWRSCRSTQRDRATASMTFFATLMSQCRRSPTRTLKW
jgi:hypothetical protein